MTLYVDLCGLYRKYGFDIIAGVPQAFSLHQATEHTWLFRNGIPLTHHLGVSPYELYFLQSLCEHIEPRRIFTVGNSFGWSSLSLAMLNPAAKVVTLELGQDEFTFEWIERTNAMALSQGLDVTVVRGASPRDVPEVVAGLLDGEVDLAFIDGEHSPQQIEDDFEAVRPFATPDALFVFHDIVGFGLWRHLGLLSRRSRLALRILLGTTSGVGLLLPNDASAALLDCCAAFGATDDAAALLDYFREQEYDSMEERVRGVEKCVSDFRHRAEGTSGT
ncbi:O-methyltransferase [Microbispora rosea]|uniref:O-methyltransferase n=1 Tax=Microbispora rosea TaxID=58117 RepID=UPI0034323EEA